MHQQKTSLEPTGTGPSDRNEALKEPFLLEAGWYRPCHTPGFQHKRDGFLIGKKL
jgi:hypothetical protein